MNSNETSSWSPHGTALQSYQNGNKKASIGIKMDDGSVTWMPIEIYFRTQEEFPEIERIALDLCRGLVLDVGAGAGAHCIALQEKKLEVVGLDIVPEATYIMKERGVRKVVSSDFLAFHSDYTFDTLLFLMNGIGIVGNLEGLTQYLQHAHTLTHTDSQIILDSSDLRYGELELQFDSTQYFGEIKYQLTFNEEEGAPYQWLYIDQELLTETAELNGWLCEIIYEQEDGSYLARLTKRVS